MLCILYVTEFITNNGLYFIIVLIIGHRRASSYGSTPANTVGLRVNSPYSQRPQRADYGLTHGHSYTQLDPQQDGNIMGQSSFVGGYHPAVIPQDPGFCKCIY